MHGFQEYTSEAPRRKWILPRWKKNRKATRVSVATEERTLKIWSASTRHEQRPKKRYSRRVTNREWRLSWEIDELRDEGRMNSMRPLKIRRRANSCGGSIGGWRLEWHDKRALTWWEWRISRHSPRRWQYPLHTSLLTVSTDSVLENTVMTTPLPLCYSKNTAIWEHVLNVRNCSIREFAVCVTECGEETVTVFSNYNTLLAYKA